ncbi:hypothetical protein ACJ41O_003585 [Fusarium nematophilum]
MVGPITVSRAVPSTARCRYWNWNRWGIWAIDLADAYPNARVVGTDLSPIQPSWIPPNLQFEIEDCTREWTFQPNSIGFVHMRWLVGSIRDWNALYAEAFRCYKPGGWVESYETSSTITSDDGSVQDDSAMGQWGKFFTEGVKKLGSTFTVVEDGTQKKELEKVGFGWSKDDIQVYIAHLRREMRAGKSHAYYRQKVVWGRKPILEE